MAHSMHTADVKTHIRIVAISLIIGIVVVLTASYARPRLGGGTEPIAANSRVHALLR
jgi:hypothetical protein